MTKERLKKTIGSNIRAARLSRGMSIDELSELLQLTSGFVGLIERGSRGATVYTLYKLADIMEASIDSFFFDSVTGGSNSGMKLAENKKSRAGSKREKISSLLVDFTESELDFIISTVKSLRSLNHSHNAAAEDETEYE